MIYQLSNIIAERIDGEWTDRKVGLVQVVKVREGQSLPFECGVTEAECTKTKAVVPDEKFKSVFWMEFDSEPSFQYQGEVTKGEVKLSLIVWLNGKKLGYVGCDLTSKIMSDLLRQVKSWGSFNSGLFNTVKVEVIGQRPKDFQIFRKYGANEDFRFYLKPYDFFALRLKVTFVAHCTEFELGDEVC